MPEGVAARGVSPTTNTALKGVGNCIVFFCFRFFLMQVDVFFGNVPGNFWGINIEFSPKKTHKNERWIMI